MRHLVFLCSVFGVGLGLFPAEAQAAATVSSIFDAFTKSLGNFVAIGVAIAVVVFMWGVVSMIRAGGKEGDKRIIEGKQRMFWGVIAIFILVSVWGIVTLLQTMVGVESKSTCVYTHFGDDISQAIKCF